MTGFYTNYTFFGGEGGDFLPKLTAVHITGITTSSPNHQTLVMASVLAQVHGAVVNP